MFLILNSEKTNSCNNNISDNNNNFKNAGFINYGISYSMTMNMKMYI